MQSKIFYTKIVQSKIFYTKIAQSTPKAQNGWHRGVTKRNVSSFFLFRLVPNLNIMKTLTLLGHAWYFVVYIIHQTLTWAPGSLTCVCDPFACVYTRGTSVYSLIRRISFACHFPWLKKEKKKKKLNQQLFSQFTSSQSIFAVVDELLDNYLADMDPEEVEALVSQMLLDQEQEGPPPPLEEMQQAARAALRQRELADAFGYYYPEETQ